MRRTRHMVAASVLTAFMLAGAAVMSSPQLGSSSITTDNEDPSGEALRHVTEVADTVAQTGRLQGNEQQDSEQPDSVSQKKAAAQASGQSSGQPSGAASDVPQPDMPVTEGFVPTMISDLKAADPLSKINLIMPPEAGSTGAATLHYSFCRRPETACRRPQESATAAMRVTARSVVDGRCPYRQSRSTHAGACHVTAPPRKRSATHSTASRLPWLQKEDRPQRPTAATPSQERQNGSS